jgi:hypothetical protein
MSNNVVTSDSAAGRGPAQNSKFKRDQKAGKNKKSIPVRELIEHRRKDNTYIHISLIRYIDIMQLSRRFYR